MKSNTDRHQIRNTLLLNGYRPLPLADKGIFITGWVDAEITEEWLGQWARHARYANTGIRCDDLIAIDIDILEESLADEIEDYVEGKLGLTELCRVGKHPKRLLLYRVKGDQGRSARTGRFVDGAGLVHQVELLSGRGRQFAAFGTHPGTGKPYEWLGPSPLDISFADLPVIGHEAARAALSGIEERFTGHGLQQTRAGYEHGLGGGSEYDLTDDTEVEADGQIICWGDLKVSLDKTGCFGNLRREDGEFGDSGGVHFMLAHGSAEPCAHDFVRDVTHWDSLAAPQLAGLLPAPGTSTTIFTPPAVTELIENWAILSDLTIRPLDEPTRSVALQGFIRNMKHLRVPDPNPPASQPNRTLPATEVWEKSPLTVRADYAELRPDKPDDEVFRKGAARVLNTYMPPEHADTSGELATVFEFIDHLVPRETERDIFWDWHASKFANPQYRQHALIMVTPAYGTGRGTWVQILQSLFGIQYVNEIPLDRIVGQGSQSQFNEYLADSLIVTVGEALVEDAGRSKWTARHLAYERIKTTIEPQATHQHITRKYGRNSVERVFASLFITSNHPDALAIEPDDRRVVALSNTEIPLTDAAGSLLNRIHAWRQEDRNIGALAVYLTERAERLSYDPLGMPPMTPAKAAMIEAAQSDTERLFEAFQEESEGAVATHSQWRTFAHANRMRLEVELPSDQDKLNAALTAVMRKHARRPETTVIKIKGVTVRPWILRDFGKWKVAANSAVRAELLKNGPPGASVVEFPVSGK